MIPGSKFEFSLLKEWSRQEQIDYTTEYIQKIFLDKGMCADWSIHDKGDGNPHVHLLVTMRPFNSNHSWAAKGSRTGILSGTKMETYKTLQRGLYFLERKLHRTVTEYPIRSLSEKTTDKFAV